MPCARSYLRWPTFKCKVYSLDFASQNRSAADAETAIKRPPEGAKLGPQRRGCRPPAPRGCAPAHFVSRPPALLGNWKGRFIVRPRQAAGGSLGCLMYSSSTLPPAGLGSQFKYLLPFSHWQRLRTASHRVIRAKCFCSSAKKLALARASGPF
jgi:hypothetical protein